MKLASAGATQSAAAQDEAQASAEIRKVPTPREALWTWCITVVPLSLLALVGPWVIPWLHTGQLNVKTSFGKGELIGFSFALFAAALSRWVVHEGDRKTGLMVFSILGMACVAAAIALLWFDAYQVQTGQARHSFLQVQQVVTLSWILVGMSVICGASTEIVYARSLQQVVKVQKVPVA
jgi:heme/copper-type cytochrome/quinol oxidase subunit 4